MLNNNIWGTLISYLGWVLATWTQLQPSLPVLIPPESEEPVLPGIAFPQWDDVDKAGFPPHWVIK